MYRGCFGLLVFLGTAAAASAHPKVTLPEPKDGRIERLVPVMAQSARCVAVSDVHGLLAFGHDRGYADAHVTVFRLDAKGNPGVYGAPIRFPLPKGLEKYPAYVLSVAFHPKLPLLYVWQEIAVNYSNPPPPAPPEIKDFDHLQIFNVSKETPELVLSFCRGPEFIYGQHAGGIAVDGAGDYLYVPNMRELKNAGSLRNGRFPLDADGLPMVSEQDAKLPLVARVKALTALNVAKPPAPPPQLTPIEYVHIFNFTNYGSISCYRPIAKNIVLASTMHGLLTWRPEDKNVPISALPLQQYGHTQFAVHPTLPVIFATASHRLNPNTFFRVEHVEGYLTLLPKQYTIPGSELSGPPAIMPKTKKLVLGGHYGVYEIGLDDKGIPAGDVIQMRVLSPAVQALVYSERFDRLYVGVEVSK